MSIDQSDVVEVDPPTEIEDTQPELYRWLYENFLRIRELFTDSAGVDGTFTTTDSKTITVKNGVITSITP